MDEADHPGFVERQRRASGQEEVPEDEPTYVLYSLGGAPCIMAQLDAIFYLEYHTLRHGIQKVRVDLPKEPTVTGSCVRDGDTAVLTMTWSVFNFSLVFTENPEGNSYYLNTAILKYNQSLDMFTDASYHKRVIAKTQKVILNTTLGGVANLNQNICHHKVICTCISFYCRVLTTCDKSVTPYVTFQVTAVTLL